MPSHASLDAAAQDRKSRLAQLKSLKRKAPDSTTDSPTPLSPSTDSPSALESSTTTSSTPYLSGRNYDPTTRGPKLGFEHSPAASADTAERRAQDLAAQAAAEAEQEAQADEAAKQLDLFKLQPKKANWDLKRDVERRMEGLNVLTENAIARAVRERVRGQKRGLEGENGGGEDGEGFKGEELVSALHAKEAREEEEERREREEDEQEEEGFK